MAGHLFGQGAAALVNLAHFSEKEIHRSPVEDNMMEIGKDQESLGSFHQGKPVEGPGRQVEGSDEAFSKGFGCFLSQAQAVNPDIFLQS